MILLIQFLFPRLTLLVLHLATYYWLQELDSLKSHRFLSFRNRIPQPTHLFIQWNEMPLSSGIKRPEPKDYLPLTSPPCVLTLGMPGAALALKHHLGLVNKLNRSWRELNFVFENCTWFAKVIIMWARPVRVCYGNTTRYETLKLIQWLPLPSCHMTLLADVPAFLWNVYRTRNILERNFICIRIIDYWRSSWSTDTHSEFPYFKFWPDNNYTTDDIFGFS
jgi:hypothetical protein